MGGVGDGVQVTRIGLLAEGSMPQPARHVCDGQHVLELSDPVAYRVMTSRQTTLSTCVQTATMATSKATANRARQKRNPATRLTELLPQLVGFFCSGRGVVGDAARLGAYFRDGCKVRF